MKIDIDVGDVEATKRALACAIAYTNGRLKSGVDSSHPERHPTSWWDNFVYDVAVARTLRELLDSFEKKDAEVGNESGVAK